jgi:signal peptidase I
MGEKHKKKAVTKISKEASFEVNKTRRLIKKKRKRLETDKITLLETDILALEKAMADKDPKEILAKEERLVKARDRVMPFLNKSVVREYAEAIIIAVVLALFIRTFIVQAFKIPSGSMEDTLLVGDHLLVNKFIYGIKFPFFDNNIIDLKEVKRGDVIVFRYPEDKSKDFIKRVIATGGDKIEVKNKQVFINDEATEQPFAVFKASETSFLGFQKGRNFGPFTVPEGHVFVMGDNRDNSHDSRFWGTVDIKEIKGKAFILYWSWDRDKKNVRFSRIGSLIK